MKIFIYIIKMNKRLYILIDNSLEPIYGCVQGGHVVAQWLLEHPQQDWNNSYLIYLSADLEKYKTILISRGIDFSEFHEPDLDNKLTAIACENNDRLFRKLKLISEKD